MCLAEKELISMTVTDVLTVDSLTVQSGLINGNISIDDLDNNTARTDRTQVGQLFPPPPTRNDRKENKQYLVFPSVCVYKYQSNLIWRIFA